MLLPDVPAEVFTSADAIRHGATQRQLEWAVRTQKLRRLRPGVFCRVGDWTAADPRRQHALEARAVALARRSPTPFALSHVSAAAVLSLPVPEQPMRGVWVTVAPGGHTRRRDGVIQQVAPLPVEDVDLVDGVPCTTRARTVADCLRHLDGADAVAIGDAALRSGRVTVDQIDRQLARQRWARATAAAALLPLLDGRRESPLESRSIVVMHRYGLPIPAPQVRVVDERGRVVARVDFAWLGHGVVGEADGLVKYADGAGRIAEEKQREARLQALGLVVVRWTRRHLEGEPPLLVAQLRAALAAGDPRRFRGRVA